MELLAKYEQRRAKKTQQNIIAHWAPSLSLTEYAKENERKKYKEKTILTKNPDACV